MRSKSPAKTTAAPSRETKPATIAKPLANPSEPDGAEATGATERTGAGETAGAPAEDSDLSGAFGLAIGLTMGWGLGCCKLGVGDGITGATPFAAGLRGLVARLPAGALGACGAGGFKAIGAMAAGGGGLMTLVLALTSSEDD